VGGRVLLYTAEDALHIVRQRLEGICAASGVALVDLDIQVITVTTLRLDLEADRRSLEETVARLRPRLLVLDPFVRLHRIDENASGEVAPLLGCLRELQRRYNLAVIVVHHAKKGAGRIRGGQALRGSSEFHAWGESNLYLRRDGDPHAGEITLTVEHRAAPAMPPSRSNSPTAPMRWHSRPSNGMARKHRRRDPSTIASSPHSQTPIGRCRSPYCAGYAAFAPPVSTNAWSRSPPQAASSKPAADISSPTLSVASASRIPLYSARETVAGRPVF
jgi:hypothetical protein